MKYKVTEIHSDRPICFILCSQNYLHFRMKCFPQLREQSNSFKVLLLLPHPTPPWLPSVPFPTHMARVRAQDWWVIFKYLKGEKEQKK